MKLRARPHVLNSILAVLLLAAQVVMAQAKPDSPSGVTPTAGLASAGEKAFAAKPALEPGVFARVNGITVSQAEFHTAFSTYLRQKYYHGEVQPAELQKARDVVTDQVINRILFLQEVERRGVKADEQEIERRIAAYDQQNSANPAWQRDRENVLIAVRKQMGELGRIARLEQQVRDVPPLASSEVESYYKANPGLFTEPERLQLHVILLSVAPSSAPATWEAAMEEARELVKRIKGGANFAEIAKVVSGDPSAAQGGDMGYVHLGMLPQELQDKVSKFSLGEVGEPIQLLQGIGIFRIDQRIAPRLMDFDKVAQRAGDLALRDNKEKTWQALVSALRAAADIQIVDGRAAPVVGTK
jgi:parvulin-like peptidyl-prolyl isomerase